MVSFSWAFPWSLASMWEIWRPHSIRALKKVTTASFNSFKTSREGSGWHEADFSAFWVDMTTLEASVLHARPNRSSSWWYWEEEDEDW